MMKKRFPWAKIRKRSSPAKKEQNLRWSVSQIQKFEILVGRLFSTPLKKKKKTDFQQSNKRHTPRSKSQANEPKSKLSKPETQI